MIEKRQTKSVCFEGDWFEIMSLLTTHACQEVLCVLSGSKLILRNRFKYTRVVQGHWVGVLKTGQRTDKVPGCVLTCWRSDFWELSAEADRFCQSESSPDGQVWRGSSVIGWYTDVPGCLTSDWGGGWERSQCPSTRQRIEPYLPVENVSELSIIRAMCCTATETQGWENLQCIAAPPLCWQEWWSMRKICFLARVSLTRVISCIPKEIVPNFVQSGLKLRSWPIITI